MTKHLDRRGLLRAGVTAGSAFVATRLVGGRAAHASTAASTTVPAAAPTPTATVAAAAAPTAAAPAPSARAGGTPYTPVVVPNGRTLPYQLRGGVKVFHLVAEEVDHEFVPGLRVKAWGYNGGTPGPLIEAVEGDRVRIYVTNKLPEPTTVHWHGVLLPCGMDGVGGLTQDFIQPGKTFKYEFTCTKAGTFMYHPHYDEMTQIALGMVGMIVVHPRKVRETRRVRDYALMMHEWKVPIGASRPDPMAMADFNVLTFNSKSFPATAPLVAQVGDLVRIRLGNLGPMDSHPVHLHGYAFTVTETDGGQVPASARWPETTVIVPVGAVRVIEFVADVPGDWAIHCHMTHHVMNQMGHDVASLVGVDATGLDRKLGKLVPGYMTMGTTGMGDMMRMDMPENSVSMMGAPGPFDMIDMGGMFTIVKVRPAGVPIEPGVDPGWYEHPDGTVAAEATAADLASDGVTP